MMAGDNHKLVGVEVQGVQGLLAAVEQQWFHA